jgi:hypothetical protein
MALLCIGPIPLVGSFSLRCITPSGYEWEVKKSKVVLVLN